MYGMRISLFILLALLNVGGVYPCLQNPDPFGHRNWFSPNFKMVNVPISEVVDARWKAGFTTVPDCRCGGMV